MNNTRIDLTNREWTLYGTMPYAWRNAVSMELGLEFEPEIGPVPVQVPGSVQQALIEAGEKRLRPILMTTVAMVFAMIPLALGTGLGSETNAPMAISVIGGLLSSMVLTLLVVPVIYRLINPLDRWLRKFYENKATADI